MSFFGGAFVFPGGRVEASDVGAASESHPWSHHVHPVAGRDFCPDLGTLYGAYKLAAVREVHEETGIRLLPTSLIPWARWITPEFESKRFDTMFFLAQIPADAPVTLDENEAIAHRFLTPEEALDAERRNMLLLPPPTEMTLRELAAVGDAWPKGRHPLPEFLPRLRTENGKLRVVLP
jgi:8-oxo-dGTP pyrophosphatase MutT (NUDIX family)